MWLEKPGLYDEYWVASGRERSTVQLKTTAYFVLILETLFIGLDWLAYREHVAWFLPMRIATNVLALAVLVRLRFTYPRLSEYAITLAVVLHILAMVYATGAAMSHYYAGLIIVLVGMPVLQPLTARDAVAISTVVVVGFALSPAFTKGPMDWMRFGIHAVFVFSGALESVMSCRILSNARLREYCQRRELREARDHLAELDRQKSRFTANVHHELRTPLTLMLAPLDTLLAGDLGEVSREQRQYLTTMRENGLRLLKLINQLLDLARIESRQKELERRPVDAGAVAQRILESARPLAERKGVALEGRGLEAVPVIRADADAIEKVLVNLLGNALKFTDRGGRITLRAETTTETVCFQVEDTGIGIPADQIGRVFDRFAQVDGSATRKHEGTGIGLALVKELVELHGGSVSVASEGLGHGATFRVVLPLDEVDSEAPDEEVVRDPQGRGLTLEDAFAAVGAEAGLAADGPGPEAGDDYRVVDLRRTVERAEAVEEPVAGAVLGQEDGPEVLVVEDNADMRRLLAFILGREFRVRLAENGRRGLEAVRESPPQLVLSDVMMPEMSGLELCAALKADEATRSIPVVLVTSKAEREMKIEGLERGADDYVTKPFHPRELVARVRNLVRLHWLQAEIAQQNDALSAALRELKSTEVQLVQSERLAAVGELAAGVAHEVNNPVNFSLNAVRTLRRAVEDVRAVAERVARIDATDAAHVEAELAEVRALLEERHFAEQVEALEELVGIVSEGLDRTARLVGDLRDFAAPGRRGRGSVDLRRGLDSTAQLVRRAAADAGATIVLDVPPQLPTVHGDAGALNQLFLNLLKNAVEAFDRPGGTIRVSVEVGGPNVVLRFHDDGPGMEADVLAQLFEPFFTTKQAGRGSGLGLSICRRIATEHGGALRVQSTPGEGSTFEVTLPVEGASPPKPESEGREGEHAA